MDKLAIATRRVDEAERAEAEQAAVTHKLVRGHIQDMALELQFLGLKHRTTTPETVEFQDRIYVAFTDFIEASKSRMAARDYVTPARQVQSTQEVSAVLREEEHDPTAPGAATEFSDGKTLPIGRPVPKVVV